MWYWVFRVLFKAILKLFFRLKVEGLENLPQKSNFIIVANHVSFLDSLIVGVAVPKRIYWIAARYLYKLSWMRWFLQKLKVLPVGSASERLVNLLSQNKNVGLFPEGIRSTDGKVGQFRRGVALLALKTGRPVIPCAILGAYEAFPRGAKFPRFVPIKVKISKPIYLLKEFDDVIDDLYLQEGIFKIRDAVIKEMQNDG